MKVTLGTRDRDLEAARGERFVDFPRRLDMAMYDEAVEQYGRAVKSRAVAVYRGGRVRFPGLSDIDLLVVVDDQPVWDNEEYFSPFVRLPRRYHELFHHRPHFVPRSCIDALAYSTFAYTSKAAAHGGVDDAGFRRQLVVGDDVVPKTWPMPNYSWYLCSLFETAITARLRFDHFRASRQRSVRRLASMAATFRFPLRQLDELSGTSYEGSYSAIIDRARAELLETGGDVQAAADVLLTLYEATLSGFERSIGELANARQGEPAVHAAREILAARRVLPAIEPSYLASRRDAIHTYFDRLRRTKISGLTIFVREPYRAEVQLYRQPLWVGRTATALRTAIDALG
ncbi:MAG TPA: hypothetical protein VFO25_07145 [Candidatus Eremiobacteraceae bacterium]|nr:hypothetical protein [Candidatus Eremiobacteraceae bacterium]